MKYFSEPGVDYPGINKIDEKELEWMDPEEKSEYGDSGPVAIFPVSAWVFPDEDDEEETEEIDPNELFDSYLLVEEGEELESYASIDYFTDDSHMLLKLETVDGIQCFEINHEPAIVYDYEQPEILKDAIKSVLEKNRFDPKKTHVVVVKTM